MWNLPCEPNIGKSAFDKAQVETLRRVVQESRPFMRKVGQSFTNSVSYFDLEKGGRPDLFATAFETFMNSKAHEFAVSTYPEGYCFLLDYCALRHHDPDVPESQLKMHFDANFLGTSAKVYNVWVTLDDVGDGAPGLTFLRPGLKFGAMHDVWRKFHDEAVATRGPDAPINLMFDAERLLRHYRQPADEVFMTPRVKAGEFIAFHQLVAHATETVTGTPKPRSSIEFRISSVAAVPNPCRTRGSKVAVCRTDEDGKRFIEVVGVDELG